MPFSSVVSFCPAAQKLAHAQSEQLDSADSYLLSLVTRGPRSKTR